MLRILPVCLILVVVACSPPLESVEGGDSFAALLSGAPQVYVLDKAENQRGDPIITFDHVCDGGVRIQSALRDTIELFPDGSARRAIYIEHLRNGEVVGSSYIPAPGTWTSKSVTLATGTTLTLQLAPASGSYSMPMRVSSRTTLSRGSYMGGVCRGSALDDRAAEFVYTSR